MWRRGHRAQHRQHGRDAAVRQRRGRDLRRAGRPRGALSDLRRLARRRGRGLAAARPARIGHVSRVGRVAERGRVLPPLSALPRSDHAVAQMRGVVAIEPPEQLQLMSRLGAAEEAPAGTQEDRDEVDLELVELTGLEQGLGGAGAVDHDRAPARGFPGRFGAGDHVVEEPGAVGRRLAFVGMPGQDQDRYAVVVVTVPAAGELEGPSARDDGAGGQRLGVHLPVDAGAVAFVEPVEQPPAVAAELLARTIVRAGDVAVQGHRHVQPNGHGSSSVSGSMHVG